MQAVLSQRGPCPSPAWCPVKPIERERERTEREKRERTYLKRSHPSPMVYQVSSWIVTCTSMHLPFIFPDYMIHLSCLSAPHFSLSIFPMPSPPIPASVCVHSWPFFQRPKGRDRDLLRVPRMGLKRLKKDTHHALLCIFPVYGSCGTAVSGSWLTACNPQAWGRLCNTTCYYKVLHPAS